MTLRQDIEVIAEEEGYDGCEQFIYHCIFYRAWSFPKIGTYLAKVYNRHYSDIYIYKVCRPLIEGKIYPYRIRKWNSYAKIKGFSSAIVMFRQLAKLSTIDIMINYSKIPKDELKKCVYECCLDNRQKRLFVKGISYYSVAKKWNRKAVALGYSDIRHMFKDWPHTIKELANRLNIHEQAIYYIKRMIFKNGKN